MSLTNYAGLYLCHLLPLAFTSVIYSGAGSLGRMFARARVEWCMTCTLTLTLTLRTLTLTPALTLTLSLTRCMTCTRRAAALARAPSPQPLMARRGHAADAAEGEGEARVATGIWLHSLRYALPGLQLRFESAPPRFACDDFDHL